MKLPLLRLFFCLLLLFVSSDICAQQMLPGWQYRMPVTVRNREAKTLEHHQISFYFPTDSLVFSGKLLPDLSDLRITDSDGLTELCFWPERKEFSTKIWVKIPNLTLREKRTLFVYYGNPAAVSAANGNCAFLLFDEFETAEVDYSQWEEMGHENPELKHGKISLKASETDCMLRTRYSFPKPVIVEMKVTKAAGKLLGLAQLNKSELGWVSGYSLTLEAAETKIRADLAQLSPCGGYEPGYGHSLPKDAGATTGIWSLAWVTDNEIIAQWPSGNLIESNVLRGADQMKIAFGVMGCNANEKLRGELEVDWIRIRKFTLLEPEVKMGEEVVAGNKGEKKPNPAFNNQPLVLLF